jgi:hypothetical protein
MNVDMIARLYEGTESLGIHLGCELENQSLEGLIIPYFCSFQPDILDFLVVSCSGSK